MGKTQAPACVTVLGLTFGVHVGRAVGVHVGGHAAVTPIGGGSAPTRLLFPSWRTGQEGMLTDCRKMLDGVGRRIGFKNRELNLYVFRHTYCAARLQTLDGDAPVSPYTVGKELGHGGVSLVNRIYGHLGTVRHRSDKVEYRVTQHKKAKVHAQTVQEWLAVLK